jgi:hypothetical protein
MTSLGKTIQNPQEKFSQGIASRKGLRYLQPLFGQYSKKPAGFV